MTLPFIELAQLSPIAPVPGRLQAGLKLNEFKPVVVVNPVMLPFIELAQLSPIAPVPGRLQAGFQIDSVEARPCPLHRIGPVKPHRAPLHRRQLSPVAPVPGRLQTSSSSAPIPGRLQAGFKLRAVYAGCCGCKPTRAALQHVMPDLASALRSCFGSMSRLSLSKFTSAKPKRA